MSNLGSVLAAFDVEATFKWIACVRQFDKQQAEIGSM